MSLLEGIQEGQWTQFHAPETQLKECQVSQQTLGSGKQLRHIESTAWLMKTLVIDAALQTDASGCQVPPLSDWNDYWKFLPWVTNFMFKVIARNVRLPEISLSYLIGLLPLKAFLMAASPPLMPEMTQILCQRKHDFKIMDTYLQDHCIGGGHFEVMPCCLNLGN